MSDKGAREYCDQCGLAAWHSHFAQHLRVHTAADVIAITAGDLKHLGRAANMRMSQETIDKVLGAVSAAVFCDHAGLKEWHGHFVQHLGVQTATDVIAITASDLTRLAGLASVTITSKHVDEVLQAVQEEKRRSSSSGGGSGSTPTPPSPWMASGGRWGVPMAVDICNEYGLSAWHRPFVEHLGEYGKHQAEGDEYAITAAKLNGWGSWPT